MTVPLTSGSADASAGIWPCSQQISTVPVPLVSTGGGELRLLSLGEVGRYLDAEPVRQPADRLMGSVVSGLDRVSVGKARSASGEPGVPLAADRAWDRRVPPVRRIAASRVAVASARSDCPEIYAGVRGGMPGREVLWPAVMAAGPGRMVGS
jgi:hypothetical protein